MNIFERIKAHFESESETKALHNIMLSVEARVTRQEALFRQELALTNAKQVIQEKAIAALQDMINLQRNALEQGIKSLEEKIAAKVKKK